MLKLLKRISSKHILTVVVRITDADKDKRRVKEQEEDNG